MLTINPEFTAAQRQLVQVERKTASADAATKTVVTNTAIVPDYGNPANHDTKPTIELINRPTAATTTSAPVVDLGPLIHEMFPESVTDETHPVAALPVPNAPEPATIVIEQTARPEAISTGTPATDTAIVPVRAVEYFNENEAPLTQPSVKAIQTTTTITQQPQPLRWDLTLADMARALNNADNQKRGLDEIQRITLERAPTPSVRKTQETTGDSPVTSTEEVILVLAASETRIVPLSAEPVAMAPIAAPVYHPGTQMLDDMDVSLQILRNEIQCQKENGTIINEGIEQPRFEQAIPVNTIPVLPQTVDPNQRTQTWQMDFNALDNWLAVVRNETNCTQDTALAQIRPVTHEHEKELDQQMPAYYYGPALYAPPATTPRRTR